LAHPRGAGRPGGRAAAPPGPAAPRDRALKGVAFSVDVDPQ
jgi:hypothetical protein